MQVDAMEAAEYAGLAVYARAVLGRAAMDQPDDVVSLAVICTVEGPGIASIDFELRNRQGLAVGGGSL